MLLLWIKNRKLSFSLIETSAVRDTISYFDDLLPAAIPIHLIGMRSRKLQTVSMTIIILFVSRHPVLPKRSPLSFPLLIWRFYHAFKTFSTASTADLRGEALAPCDLLDAQLLFHICFDGLKTQFLKKPLQTDLHSPLGLEIAWAYANEGC